MNHDPLFFAANGVPTPVTEYRFHPTRRWRFDYAWPAIKLALEIEGGVWTRGRHISPKGFLADMEKYNAAACLGWRIVRVTPKSLGTLAVIRLVRSAMEEAAA